jgi:hypothetical protein
MEIFAIAILTLAASWVGTVSGFGASTIMVPILLFFFPLPAALLLGGIIHWALDIWKILLFRGGARWRLIMSFGIPGMIATFFGARIVFTVPETLLSQGLGAFFLLYGIFLVLKPSFRVAKSDIASVLGGSLSGFFAGVFGAGGAFRSAFLAALDLPKAVYIATSGAIGLAIDTVRVGTYISSGARLDPMLLWGLPLFIALSFVGAKAAQKFVHKIPQEKFRLVVAIFLSLVGIRFIFF